MSKCSSLNKSEHTQKPNPTRLLSATEFAEFMETMGRVVIAANKLRDDIEIAAKKHGLTIDQISGILSEEFDLIFHELQKEFPGDLPEDSGGRHTERVKIVSWVMDKVESPLVKVTILWGIPESDTKMRFQEIKRHVKNILIFVGMHLRCREYVLMSRNSCLFILGHIGDRHPVLLEMLIFSVVAMFIPSKSLFILNPLLGLFGFGPYGPVKGAFRTPQL